MSKFTQSMRLSPEEIARRTRDWPAALDLKRISRHFEVRVFDREQREHVEHQVLSNVVLHRGGVYLNGKAVANAVFSRNLVRFAHKTASSYTSAVLNFTPDGLAFTGKVFVGSTEADAQGHDVAGVTPPTIFKTRVAKMGATPSDGKKFPEWGPPEPAEADAAAWGDGLNLVVGYEFKQAGDLPEPILQLTDPSGAWDPVDIGDNCALSVDPKNQNLIITMVIDDPSMAGMLVEQCGDRFPGAFIVELGWDGASFRGELQHFDTDKQENEDTQLAWHGSAPVTSATKLAPSAVAAAAGKPQASLPADLSVAELFSLQPDAQTLQNNQYNVLVENMKWALSCEPSTSPWLDQFFKETAPSGLSADRQDLIKKDLSFYTDRFAVCYLGTAFNKMTGDGAPTTKLTDAQSLNLAFYMRAGLACEKGYTSQSHAAFLAAFTETLPRLQDYIRDQTPGDPKHDWAQQLYDEVTSPFQLNQSVLKVIAGHGMEDANRHSTVLLALQPSGKLAQKYHALITNASMSRAIEHLKFDDEEAMQSWLTDSIQGFIDALEQDKLKVEGGDPATQAALIAQAQALKDAAAEASSIANLAAALVNLSVAAGGKGFWDKLSNTESAWGQAGYKFARMIYSFAIVAGLAHAIKAFMQWDTLSKNDQAKVIVSTVQTTAKLIGSVPEIVSDVKWTYKEVSELYRSCSDPKIADDLEEVEKLLLDSDEDPMSYGATNMGGLANVEDETLELEGSAWVKVFNDTVGKVCRVIGVCAAVAFAITSTIQLIKDIIAGAPLKTEVLDGIVLAANVGVAICAVAGLCTSATFVPVVGAVFAIIGIVAALIEMFWPPEPPPNPVEVFMKEQLVPAASGGERWILDAPEKWGIDKTVPVDNPYSRAVKAALN